MKIPDSLILLDETLLEQILISDKEIMDLNWFLFRRGNCDLIFVDQTEVEKLVNGLVEGTSPNGCNLKNEEFLAIVPNGLKRFSVENGFYSA
jgi:hypothetical protein